MQSERVVLINCFIGIDIESLIFLSSCQLHTCLLLMFETTVHLVADLY